MTKWFALSPVGESFLTSAPHRTVHTMDLPVPAERVWEGLTNATPLSWCRMLTGGRYTSPAPHGVGTTREVGVAGGVLKLREQFFVWDETKMRHAFYVTHTSLPVFESFAEDYLVEPTPAGCRFTWTFALKAKRGLSLPVAATQPVNNLVLFNSFRRDTIKHFTG